MSNRHEQRAPDVQYEPDESPPALVSLGSGLQLVVLGITSIIFIPTIVVRASGGTDAYLSWTVFGAVAVSGICTALQAVRLSRVGAGYLLFMGPAGAYIGVCVSALIEGGPALLATLVVASSLVPDRDFDATGPVQAASHTDHRRYREHADTCDRAAGRIQSPGRRAARHGAQCAAHCGSDGSGHRMYLPEGGGKRCVYGHRSSG